MKQTTLYTLTGLPYAGKTTLRNVLSRRFGFITIAIDEINDEHRMGPDTMTQEDWNKTYSEAYDRLKSELSSGKSVVFDGGSLLFHERETQRNIAQACGARHKLIYVNTPIETIKQRWKTNQETKERGHVPENVFGAALDMWEEPTEKENPILYNQDMNLEEWIKRNTC